MGKKGGKWMASYTDDSEETWEVPSDVLAQLKEDFVKDRRRLAGSATAAKYKLKRNSELGGYYTKNQFVVDDTSRFEKKDGKWMVSYIDDSEETWEVPSDVL